MLNELLIVEWGARQAGVEMFQTHPDVKEVARIPTLLVKLDPKGHVASVRPVPREARPWTLRDAQQNSFPFVRRMPALLAVAAADERRNTALDKRSGDRRAALLALAEGEPCNQNSLKDWPGQGLLNRLRERREQLDALLGTKADVVPTTIERFLLACDSSSGEDPCRLLHGVKNKLVEELRQTAREDWLEIATALLLGKFSKKRNRSECSGALLFEANGAQSSILDPSVAAHVSSILGQAGASAVEEGHLGICGLTGGNGPLLFGPFPQPNLPVLGQTYLFAKNSEIPANDRYGRFSTKAMPVGQETAMRLAAVFKALTSDERLGVTWCAIPGEAPKQNDLLLAFVELVPDAPAAAALADDDVNGDMSEEALDDGRTQSADSIAAFEKRTERLMDAVRGKVGSGFGTLVRIYVFRKVDPANRKVVCAATPTVSDLHDAAAGWAAGERNVPTWLRLMAFRKGDRELVQMAPPHIAPLGVIPFSKQLFIRLGTQRKEVTGVGATEALGLFLEPVRAMDSPAGRRVLRMLRTVLFRRSTLVSGTAHGLRQGFDFARAFDRREALRTVTLLGVLLHKLGRTKEEYMSDTAFKLGQLLAAADVVHAGYCADVRGGDVPPSLLGNQIFRMAQSTPVKALSTLSRRWKPYDGWAKQAARQRDRADSLTASKRKDDQRRGWDIRRALRQAREMRPLAGEIGSALASCTVDDLFRAELLLGYIAGLPSAKERHAGHTDQVHSPRKEEE